MKFQLLIKKAGFILQPAIIKNRGGIYARLCSVVPEKTVYFPQKAA
jgi:hypothetical protein